MKASDVARVRLAAQLVAKPARSPVEVVRRMGAMQGQDFRGTLWAVALRTKGATRRDVEEAFAKRRIVRTWAMRGTLQFVAAEDARWMVELFAERVIRGAAGRHRALKLDVKTLARADDVLRDAVADAPLGRRALVKLLDEHRISPKGQRGIHMLQHASLRGHLVQVGFEKNEAIFASTRVLGRETRLARDEALDELARRYFTTRGPATLKDLVWWTGLPARDAKASIARVEEELAHGEVGGIAHWWARGAKPARGPRVDLLPGFDEILLAYADRSAAMDARAKRLWWPGGGAFRPTVFVDGQMRGVWAWKKGEPVVRRSGTIPKVGLARAAERYARYLAG